MCLVRKQKVFTQNYKLCAKIQKKTFHKCFLSEKFSMHPKLYLFCGVFNKKH